MRIAGVPLAVNGATSYEVRTILVVSPYFYRIFRTIPRKFGSCIAVFGCYIKGVFSGEEPVPDKMVVIKRMFLYKGFL
jgi:hypothetical protein